MRNNVKFFTSFILAGMVVVLGIYTAAGGLENMAPEVSGRIIEFSQEGTVCSGAVFGKDFIIDTAPTTEAAAWVSKEIEPVLERLKNCSLEKIFYIFRTDSQ